LPVYFFGERTYEWIKPSEESFRHYEEYKDMKNSCKMATFKQAVIEIEDPDTWPHHMPDSEKLPIERLDMEQLSDVESVADGEMDDEFENTVFVPVNASELASIEESVEMVVASEECATEVTLSSDEGPAVEETVTFDAKHTVVTEGPEMNVLDTTSEVQAVIQPELANGVETKDQLETQKAKRPAEELVTLQENSLDGQDKENASNVQEVADDVHTRKMRRISVNEHETLIE
jgi:hypothetical protein